VSDSEKAACVAAFFAYAMRHLDQPIAVLRSQVICELTRSIRHVTPLLSGVYVDAGILVRLHVMTKRLAAGGRASGERTRLALDGAGCKPLGQCVRDLFSGARFIPRHEPVEAFASFSDGADAIVR
jgi:hypothetical protein